MKTKQSNQEQEIKTGYFNIKHELFWSVGLTLLGAFFIAGLYVGNTKYDKNLIELSDTNKSLKDTLKIRDKIIQFIRHNSDTAINILSNMPYKEMKLDTLSFRKVQTTIENAGFVLNLNKARVK